ncbi:MAG: PQ-loop domain-containing transporter [Mariprofundaceae bacterium]|nr:PQ-loop domain-containing transporter [Mariprofundaceae bacterium]
MVVDAWQWVGSVAAVIFTVGFIDQLKVTWKSKDVDGLSQWQWFIFTIASSLFTIYYIHLEQWLMVGISAFGTLCCLSMVMMISYFKKKG